MKHALMSKSNGFRGNRNRAPTVLKQGKTQSPTGRAGLLRAVHGILRPDSCLSGDGFGLLPTWENRYFFVQGPKTKSFRLHGRRYSPSFKARRPSPSDFTGGDIALLSKPEGQVLPTSRAEIEPFATGNSAMVRSVRSMLQQWPCDRLEQRNVEVNTLAPTPTKDE